MVGECGRETGVGHMWERGSGCEGKKEPTRDKCICSRHIEKIDRPLINASKHACVDVLPVIRDTAYPDIT
jgi:hypothetical protein